MGSEERVDDPKMRLAGDAFSRMGLGFEPYAFQEKVAELLAAGRNVLLTAPTGSGKTLTALAPVIAARSHGNRWIDRVIYALPLRTLVSSIAEDARGYLEPLGLKVTVQMGSQPDDPLFDDGDVIFTTIDQVLSSYIGQAYSVARGQRNMVPGALLGALVVFDEFHLMDAAGSLSTAVDLAIRLSAVTQVLLMTATCPYEVACELARRTASDIVRVGPQELARIPSQANKVRSVHTCDRALTAEDVIRCHRGRSLAVVNSVKRAQELYQGLKDWATGNGIHLSLIHSRFLPRDRITKERELREFFGRGRSGRGVVIATQVVEAGMDVSFDTLHTEIAPANSIVQRIGRCARYAGETGTVYVYPLTTDENGRPQYGPYADLRIEVDTTFKALCALQGSSIDYVAECNLVDIVHTQRGLSDLHSIRTEDWSTRVRASIENSTAGATSELVRGAWSVAFILSDDPSRIRDPYAVDRFSVDHVVLRGLLSALDLAGDHAKMVWYPEEIPEESQGTEGPAIRWRAATSVAEALVHPFLAVSPRIARYDPDLGLVLGVPGAYESRPDPARVRTQKTWRYIKESYMEHVDRSLRCFWLRSARHQVAFEKVAFLAASDPWKLKLLMSFAVALHDVGKLDESWQRVIWAWQRAKERAKDRQLASGEGELSGAVAGTLEDRSPGTTELSTAPPVRPAVFEPLAHADYFSDADENEARKTEYRRPPHAAEGAYIAAAFFEEMIRALTTEPTAGGCRDASEDLCDEVLLGVLAAIAHHHGGRGRPGQFKLVRSAIDVARRSLKKALQVYTATYASGYTHGSAGPTSAGCALPAGGGSDRSAMTPLSEIRSVVREFRLNEVPPDAIAAADFAEDLSSVARTRVRLMVYWLTSRLLRLADHEATAWANML